MQRRQFIKGATASLALLSHPNILAHPLLNTEKPKRIIWVLLRGALDGLHTVIPQKQSEISMLKHLRPNLYQGIEKQLLPLNKSFALHPALTNIHSWFHRNQALPIVNVSSGYKERSHFDGQDFIESGLDDIDYDSGWLARALSIKSGQGLAIEHAIPISLRSHNDVDTWYPSNIKHAEESYFERLTAMYKDEPLLSQQLSKGLNLRAEHQSNKKRRFADLCQTCANMMHDDADIDAAMLTLGGWDTHNNQVNRLNRQLAELDSGLAKLKTGLDDDWQHTVIIVATEFGRTVKENGTTGTDHGTGSSMFLLGGAVNGGQVIGNYSGLAENQLFEGRDLGPSSNVFSWLSTLLSQHWQMSDQNVSGVFPSATLYDYQLITQKS